MFTWLRRLAPLPWVGVILSLPYILPSPVKTSVGSTIPGADLMTHGGEYLLLGLLVRQALGTFSTASRRAWWTLGLVAAFGVLDELLQGLIPSRDPSVVDWLVDVAGVSVALLLYPWLEQAIRRWRAPGPAPG